MTNENKDVSAEAEVTTDTVETTVEAEAEVSEVATAATDEVAEDGGVEPAVPAAQEEVAYPPRPSDGQPV